MQRFSLHHPIGVARGSAVLFSAFEDGGPMWTGEGPREVRQTVAFEVPFQRPPVVQVGVGMWDIGAEANQRADITAEAVTPAGFEIVFRTWGDTRVARIRADWLAIGALDYDPDWDD